MNAAAIEARMRTYQTRVQAVLDAALPDGERPPQRLHAAQRYAVLGGGKRLRPFLVVESAAVFGVPREAALLAGIPNAWVRLQTLVLMGAIAGLSGSLYVGFRGAIDPQEGSDFVLTVIAAVIIGGTPLSGGYGTVWGAMIGMLIIQVISSGIIFFGIDATWSTFVTGAVIIVAVVLDQIVKYHRLRRAAAQRFLDC